ncbi:MAG: phosphoserine phosphatase SerB [Pseudomonadota bacterium]
MDHVLVLTSAGPLPEERAEAIRLAAARAARVASTAKRLAVDAVEIAFAGEPAAVLSVVRGLLIGASVDANVVPAADRAKRILICDMDSTIIPVECIDEIADFAGVKDRVSAITERAMQGELDFEAALRERVGLLKGLPEETLQQVYYERVSLNPGAADMVAAMNEAGALTALVSGGFTFFTERVAAAAGFQRHQANTLLAADGALTGEPGTPILGKQAKLEALERYAAELGCAPADAVAVGDGANDLAMIGAAGLGVAYRAKPAVAQAADARLDHSDLTAVLRLQGMHAPGFG